GLEVSSDLKRFETGGCRTHLPPLHAQRHREQVGEHLLVVDCENAQRRAIGTVQFGQIRGHGTTLRNQLCDFYGERYAWSVSSCSQMLLISLSARSVIATMDCDAFSALPV